MSELTKNMISEALRVLEMLQESYPDDEGGSAERCAVLLMALGIEAVRCKRPERSFDDLKSHLNQQIVLTVDAAQKTLAHLQPAG